MLSFYVLRVSYCCVRRDKWDVLVIKASVIFKRYQTKDALEVKKKQSGTVLLLCCLGTSNRTF